MTQTSALANTERFLDLPEIEKIIGFRRAWIYKAMRKGDFPRPISFGNGPCARVRWLESEVSSWMAERIAQRYAQKSAEA